MRKSPPVVFLRQSLAFALHMRFLHEPEVTCLRMGWKIYCASLQHAVPDPPHYGCKKDLTAVSDYSVLNPQGLTVHLLYVLLR